MGVSSASPAVRVLSMAGDVLSVDSFVERVFDHSPKFPRRFSHDGAMVEGGGGRDEASQCAYLLPSSLDKIVDEDTMASEQEESDPAAPVLTANRDKAAIRIANSTAGGGGKESASRRRSTSGSPSSEWGARVSRGLVGIDGTVSERRSRGDCPCWPGPVRSGSV